MQTLALQGNPRLLHHHRIALPEHWTQLASCRAISVSLLGAFRLPEVDYFQMTRQVRSLVELCIVRWELPLQTMQTT